MVNEEKSEGSLRCDGRAEDELRAVSFREGIASSCPGSVLISMGNTQVICAASVDDDVPRWMRAQGVEGGWITAEYSMLPYSTSERSRRESTAGKVGGRTMEIQRLIGRSLRAVVDMAALGRHTIWLDCDVLQADGGTRTASITGAYVAMRLAVNQLLHDGRLDRDPVRESVAAISVGVVDGKPLLDLCYVEDVAAEVDMNVVMTADGKFVEIQGTAETEPFSKAALDKMQHLAASGIKELTVLQEKLLAGKE
jgi:ribonuclease PH